jgi:hypothetical protein
LVGLVAHNKCLILAGRRWFRRAAHRINFVPVMAPESLLKDIRGTVGEQSSDFQSPLVESHLDAVPRTAGERFALDTGQIDA